MISSSLMSKDEKEFVSGANCEMIENTGRPGECQDAHPGHGKLDSGLPCSCHLAAEKKKAVTGVERVKGRKWENEDSGLCSGRICSCLIIRGDDDPSAAFERGSPPDTTPLVSSTDQALCLLPY